MRIRIGTRKSPLALWQATQVAQKLNVLGHTTEIIPITSDGDVDQNQPIYRMGITGVFTRSLDTALLNKEIDIAVHSLKDVPTDLAQGLKLAAVLEKDHDADILIRPGEATLEPFAWENASIATGSLRRRAFILHEYPEVEFHDIRGNVQTRIQKMKEMGCSGTILSKASVARMQMEINYFDIPFMWPAVGQGVIGIACRADADAELENSLQDLNHSATFYDTGLARSFLKTLEGGCTAPIGFKSTMEAGKKTYYGCLLSLDGAKRIEAQYVPAENDNAIAAGETMAQKILNQGGTELIQQIKESISS